MTSLNQDLGKDTMGDLISMIKGFDYANADTNDNFALAQALRLVATDIVTRHEDVKRKQNELADKIAIARVAGELAGVIDALKPSRKRRWFYLGR